MPVSCTSNAFPPGRPSSLPDVAPKDLRTNLEYVVTGGSFDPEVHSHSVPTANEAAKLLRGDIEAPCEFRKVETDRFIGYVADVKVAKGALTALNWELNAAPGTKKAAAAMAPKAREEFISAWEWPRQDTQGQVIVAGEKETLNWDKPKLGIVQKTENRTAAEFTNVGQEFFGGQENALGRFVNELLDTSK